MLPSKQLKRWIEDHPGIVADIEYGSGFTTPSGRAYDVLLEKGFCVTDYGDDSHYIIEANAARVIDLLKNAKRCNCEECGVTL